jgi:glycerophosphoryl diester phosphodiesterase
MLILSHRGYWQSPKEKNSPDAFARSFEAGFGLETDVRDQGGQLVISHDPAVGHVQLFSEFLRLHQEINPELWLALNIKSDGLQPLLKREIDRHGVTNYFVFDMSVPDALSYCRAGMPTFTRQSEYEAQPAYYDQAFGVWLDSFIGDWLTEDVMIEHLKAKKRLCIVSPELHRRPHQAFWEDLRTMPVVRNDAIMLCTDFPSTAKEFFR